MGTGEWKHGRFGFDLVGFLSILGIVFAAEVERNSKTFQTERYRFTVQKQSTSKPNHGSLRHIIQPPAPLTPPHSHCSTPLHLHTLTPSPLHSLSVGPGALPTRPEVILYHRQVLLVLLSRTSCKCVCVGVRGVCVRGECVKGGEGVEGGTSDIVEDGVVFANSSRNR